MVRQAHHEGQALVDTDGRALVLDPQPANVQDRDGAVPVLKQSRRSYPFIARSSPTRATPATGRRAPPSSPSRSSASRPDRSASWSIHGDGWLLLRQAQDNGSFAWISRNRRLWKDPEATIASAKAFLYAASVMMLLRRIGCAA